MTKQPDHPFVMLARSLTRQESREYLTAMGWATGSGRGTWIPPEGVAVMEGRLEHLPPGVAATYTLRAALLTAFRRAAELAPA